LDIDKDGTYDFVSVGWMVVLNRETVGRLQFNSESSGLRGKFEITADVVVDLAQAMYVCQDCCLAMMNSYPYLP